MLLEIMMYSFFILNKSFWLGKKAKNWKPYNSSHWGWACVWVWVGCQGLTQLPDPWFLAVVSMPNSLIPDFLKGQLPDFVNTLTPWL